MTPRSSGSGVCDSFGLAALVGACPVVLWAADGRGVVQRADGDPSQVGRSVFDIYRYDSLVLRAFEQALEGNESGLQIELQGRQVVVMFAPLAGGVAGVWLDVTALHPNQAGRWRWVCRVVDALRQGRLRVAAQPIAGDGWRCSELLLRMQEGKTIVNAGRFIDAVGRYPELMRQLDRWVMGQALTLASENPGQHYFVNLSGASLATDDLLDYLAREAPNPRQITLEITEQIALNPSAPQRLKRLWGMGYTLALDDLGTGYSTLSQLGALPLHYVKLDGSLSQDLATQPHRRALLKHLVALCHDLGYEVIAEWVEDKGTKQTLENIGVKLFQGYLTGLPELL
jgi:EAL domain-containing protein (putative c-di-GMP-specific phosphodiesterase class I)